MKILVATKNPGKAREMKIFLGNGFDIVSLADLLDAPDIEENGDTFEENALLKARFYFDWSNTPSIADDAGLEIDYLNGEPGVLSRRWPGYEATDEELIEMALKKLALKPDECVMIDDNEKNLSTPSQMGFKTILYKSNTRLIKELKALGVKF